MGYASRDAARSAVSQTSTIGLVSLLLLLALSVLALISGLNKVLVVAWIAFVSMALGAWLGARAEETDPHHLVWGYGTASGAMITSAAMFLVPQAIGLGGAAGAAQLGGIGIALGILAGYSGHTIAHRLTHVDVGMDVTAAEISAHALTAGVIIGLVYGTLPGLGLLLGVAIVSHKGPAGYAAARRLRRAGKSPGALLLPAAGVGLTAIPAALLSVPDVPLARALVFGFAAGIFLHVAMDFLPHCDAGSEIHEVCSLREEEHHLLDELRLHAVASTLLGGLAVVIAWAIAYRGALFG